MLLLFFRPSISIQSFVLGLGQLPLPLISAGIINIFPVSQTSSLGTVYGLLTVELFFSFTEATRNDSFSFLYLLILLLSHSLSIFSFPFSEKWCYSSCMRKLPSLCLCLVWSLWHICTCWSLGPWSCLLFPWQQSLISIPNFPTIPFWFLPVDVPPLFYLQMLMFSGLLILIPVSTLDLSSKLWTCISDCLLDIST